MGKVTSVIIKLASFVSFSVSGRRREGGRGEADYRGLSDGEKAEGEKEGGRRRLKHLKHLKQKTGEIEQQEYRKTGV